MIGTLDQTTHYSMAIERSEEDQTYVEILPEWEGHYLMSVASGKTCAEALERGVNALEHMIEVSAKDGEPLPPPHTCTAA